ncbi:MAG: hypothetical protein ACC742_12480 [Thermoanaerobaculales bacterium]
MRIRKRRNMPVTPFRRCGGVLTSGVVRVATWARVFHSIIGHEHYGAAGGRLLHTGETMQWTAPDVLVVPWWRVL